VGLVGRLDIERPAELVASASNQGSQEGPGIPVVVIARFSYARRVGSMISQVCRFAIPEYQAVIHTDCVNALLGAAQGAADDSTRLSQAKHNAIGRDDELLGCLRLGCMSRTGINLKAGS
jgi:hypothetical protein